MEVAGDFCSSEAVSLRQMTAYLVEAVAVEAVLVAQKSVYLLLVMGSLLNGRRNFLDQESENSHGFDDSILIGMKEKNTRHVGDGGLAPENKDDGDSESDDEDEDDEEDDDGGDDEDASGDEDNDNQGDEDQEDDVEANGGGSDEEEDDEEEDEDEDEEDEDGEDEDDEDEEEEMLEPPIKKKK